jgi:hypothetical protein
MQLMFIVEKPRKFLRITTSPHTVQAIESQDVVPHYSLPVIRVYSYIGPTRSKG